MCPQFCLPYFENEVFSTPKKESKMLIYIKIANKKTTSVITQAVNRANSSTDAMVNSLFIYLLKLTFVFTTIEINFIIVIQSGFFNQVLKIILEISTENDP